jgi:hypothetical protein
LLTGKFKELLKQIKIGVTEKACLEINLEADKNANKEG